MRVLAVPLVAVAMVGSTAFGQVLYPANGHFYEVVAMPGLTWDQADAFASSQVFLGATGHLVTFSDQAENDWVYSDLAGFPLHYYWLGGYQDKNAPDYFEPDGGWRWVTGEPWAFTNWLAGEPNDSGGNEDSLHFYQADWNDAPNNFSGSPGLIIEYEPTIGTNYCVANPNSTGLPASIAAFGSEVIADNNVTLVTTDAAVNQFGYYLMSMTQGFVQNFAGSEGNLCLGGKIYRFSHPPSGEILFSGPDGVLTFSPDLTNLPQSVVFQVGETWNFQSWFRDIVNNDFTSNTSDGLAITWQ